MHSDMRGAGRRRVISRRKFVRYLTATAPLPIIVPRTALAAPGRPGANAYGELAQRAGTLCCLSTIARLVNRPLKWDPKNERFVGDEEANALLNPPRRTGYELPNPSEKRRAS